MASLVDMIIMSERGINFGVSSSDHMDGNGQLKTKVLDGQQLLFEIFCDNCGKYPTYCQNFRVQ